MTLFAVRRCRVLLASSLALAGGAVPALPAAAATAPQAAVAGIEGPGPGADRIEGEVADAPLHGQVVLRTPGMPQRGNATGSPALQDYLGRHQLKVTSISSDGTLVNFDGPAARVEDAFATRLALFRDHRDGRVFRAADTSASLPAGLASSVLAVHGLSGRYRRHPAGSASLPCAPVSPNPGGGLTPTSAKQAYSSDTGITAGLDGTGQTIGLFELNTFDATHIARYDTQYYGAPKAMPTVVTNSSMGTVDTTCAGQEEVELDIEVIRAYAPGATIKVYEAANSGDNTGANNAYAAMVADTSLSAISTSWGLCEAQQGSAETATLSQLFRNARVPIFAASGDNGAHDCADALGNPASQLAVDSPASDPMVTGVGGTTLSTSGGAYSGESGWNGSGGGLSSQFARPSWQLGPGVANNWSNGARQVPDVAYAADPASGYSVYTEGVVNPQPTTLGPGWTVIGGTSAGAPAWAATTAIYDQYAAGHSLSAMGPANPILYSAAQCTQGHTPLHDPASGNNGFYPATPGWDFVTGLGTPRVDELTAAVAGLATAPLQISGLSPAQGPASGGTSISLTGCGFGTNPSVTFGGVSAASVVRNSSTLLTVSSPAHPAGTVDMAVTNAGGSSVTLPTGFTYTDERVIAVTAPNSALYYSINGQGYAGLDGHILDAPAVVSAPGPGGSRRPLFIATGGNHDLYIRDLVSGWQPLTDSPVFCNQSPGVAVIAGSLVVACRGGDGGLWWASTAVGATALPRVSASSWQGLGGKLIAGPAVTGLGGASSPTFAVLGTDHRVYMRNLSDGGFQQYSWACNGHLALAAMGSRNTFACQGLDQALWYANYSGGWSGASSLGGRLVDGPGMALSPDGPTFYGEGADRAVWTRNLSQGWTSIGGVVNFGASAIELD